jgi:hypothetical protein
VRSPVAGIVRFRGRVAGRLVVTVATRIDEHDAVLTVTGLQASSIHVGAAVEVGDSLGNGTSVHVGAYDANRRSRYLPVVSSAADAASRGGNPDEHGSLSDTVTDRLRAAIEGQPVANTVGRTERTPLLPMLPLVLVPALVRAAEPASVLDTSSTPVQARSGVPQRPPRTSLIGAGSLAPVIRVAARSGSNSGTSAAQANDGSQLAEAIGRQKDSSTRPSLLPPARTRVATSSIDTVGSVQDTVSSEVSIDRSSSRRLRDPDGFMTAHRPRETSEMANHAPRTTLVSALGSAGADPRPIPDVVFGADRTHAQRRGADALPVLLLALPGMLLILLMLHRRSEQQPPPVQPVHAVAPAILPTIEQCRRLVDERDARLAPVPCVAFAWTDIESGTSLHLDTSTHAHTVRSPEHA